MTLANKCYTTIDVDLLYLYVYQDNGIFKIFTRNDFGKNESESKKEKTWIFI